MNERRKERLAAFVKEIMPDFFRNELSLPNGIIVSVLYVEASTSGSRANVFVSAFPDTARSEVAKILKVSENEATHFMRSRLRTKYSPSIHFFLVENALA